MNATPRTARTARPLRYWTCRGDVRGECPTYHRTEAGAQACCDRDHAGCRSQGGYSDRAPVYVDNAPVNEPVARYAIAAFDGYSEGWFCRPATAPYSERAWRRDDERLAHDREEEARELPTLGSRALDNRIGGQAPSRRQERAIRKALGLTGRRGVEFYARFDAGNRSAQEGWDIRWMA
jgi:hypothetical protein